MISEGTEVGLAVVEVVVVVRTVVVGGMVVVGMRDGVEEEDGRVMEEIEEMVEVVSAVVVRDVVEPGSSQHSVGSSLIEGERERAVDQGLDSLDNEADEIVVLVVVLVVVLLLVTELTALVTADVGWGWGCAIVLVVSVCGGERSEVEVGGRMGGSRVSMMGRSSVSDDSMQATGNADEWGVDSVDVVKGVKRSTKMAHSQRDVIRRRVDETRGSIHQEERVL